MNHHHDPPQIPSNNQEQESSLPPSASTANNQFDKSLAACCCGGSLTPPYPPDRHHFPKTPTHSPVPVLPPLPRRSVSDLNHSPAKTSSRFSTSSQDFHFSTDLDTADSKGLSKMNPHHPPPIPSNNQEQESSLPPSASTANNRFEKSLAACCCGGSLTPPYPPDRHHFPKTPIHSPGLSRMNPHHPPQIPSNNQEQESSVPPSASTANNQFEKSLAAVRCGGSLPTSPYSPDRYHFGKTPSRSSTSSQDFHFSTDLDTPDYKRLSRMKDRLRETCKIRRCFSEPYKLPSATNLNRFQRAPVVPAGASADPTFLLALMALYMAALYMALSIHPRTIGKTRPSDWSAAEIWWGILLCIGMESTFYILINWVADKPYPIRLWVALIIGKALFWISQFGNLPLIAYLPALTILNACLLGAIVVKIHRNVGWRMAYRFGLDNLGISKKLF